MSKPLRTVVLASGSGTNLQAIIDKAAAGEPAIELTGVISDRPDVGALACAIQAGIPALTCDYRAFEDRAAFDAEIASMLHRLTPDLVVLAGYMRILPDALVDDYAGRMLNIHPSLLPAYRGLHTYRRALDAGEQWHGSTVHYVVRELDAGPRIIQYRIPVRKSDTEESLAQRTQQGEYVIYPRAIGWIADGRLALRDGDAWLDDRRLVYPVVVDGD